jgi:phosphate transport system substrate-binding protein
MRRLRRQYRWGVLVLGIALVGACGGGTSSSGAGSGDGTLSGTIRVDGSSTVGPLTEAAAESFQQQNPNVQVTVGISGTGGGFEKFCNGETDISDASRSIESDEAKACAANTIDYAEVQVANDGLTLVVNPENNWATCLTVDQLKKIWEKGSTIDNWNQIDPSFPDVALELFGPGTDSGTFDYFTGAINGEEGNSRTDYTATEDDNVTVQGVAGTEGGLGYFGLSYYEANADKLKVVQVDGGGGCVTPDTSTVQSGEYTPLSRPLLIYPSDSALTRPEVDAFIRYYIDNAETVAQQAQFVPMTASQSAAAVKAVDELTGASGSPSTG